MRKNVIAEEVRVCGARGQSQPDLHVAVPAVRPGPDHRQHQDRAGGEASHAGLLCAAILHTPQSQEVAHKQSL